MWCDTLSTRRTTTNSALQCSFVQIARVVLVPVIRVGVLGVTVVHIGHDEVLVVVLKSVAIFVVIFCTGDVLFTPCVGDSELR